MSSFTRVNIYLTTFLSTCLLCSVARSQPGNSESRKWGLGIIMNKTGLVAEEMNVPKQKITLYDEEAKEVGVMYPDTSGAGTADSYWWLRVRLDSDSIIYSQTREDCIEVTYEGMCLKYYERRDRFLRVMENDLSPKSLWINLDDLEVFGYKACDWKEFIGASRHRWYRFDELGPPLALRREPRMNSERIASIQGLLYQIQIVGPWEGWWVYVEVKQYAEFDMVPSDSDILHRYHGWIKAIDPRGFPNIWFPTRD